MAYTSWNPHNAGLAHLFDARTGSSGIGAFYASPGMQPPPPSRPANSGYFPIYQDSVFCGGYGYGCGYSTPGAFTASSVESTKKTSLGDAFHHYLVNGLAWNAPGLLSWGLQALGVGANLAGNLSNNIGNYFGNFTNQAGSSNLDYVNNSLTNRVFS